MIYILLFDYLLCSLTKYSLSLFLFFLPFKKGRIYLILYFLILSFFEVKYLINLFIIILLIYIIKYYYKKVMLNSYTYLISVLFSYAIYYGLINIILINFL